MEDKRPHVADCQYLIDDRPKTVVDFVYDFDWEKRVRDHADHIYRLGPSEGEPHSEEAMQAIDDVLDKYYEEGPLAKSDFDELYRVQEEAAKQYTGATRRRAFVKAYSYNQNLTDIPYVYLAPTWSGLAWYMHQKGVLSEVPIEPVLKV